jgi:glycosyltransferase involved in cell wall biosynthesis
MSAPKVSIIIPVYNAVAYIKQCVHSVLNQTIQDIEIIAVNDGSTDDSRQILDLLASTDERLHVFHQVNKGVSTARNFGLQQSKGKYIGFCDADDWMEPEMLQELYTAITYNDCDWAICNVTTIRDEQPETIRLQLRDEIINVANDRAEFLHSLMRFKYDNANWNKLYKASIIREQNQCFNENMHIWEDLLFNLEYLQFVSKAAVIQKSLYNYRILQTSLYNSDKGIKVLQFNLLYRYYLEFANRFAGHAEIKAFKSEMARVAYSQLLYQAELHVNQANEGFPKIIRTYRNELLRFNPAIFNFSDEERRGFRGVKRQLLQRHRFKSFAFIIAVKTVLSKHFQFFIRCLKK